MQYVYRKEKVHNMNVKRKELPMPFVTNRLTNEHVSKLASIFQYGNIFTMKARPRNNLQNRPEINIIMMYNDELLRIATVYARTKNFHLLYKLRYLAEKSFILTIAKKRKMTYSQTVKRLRRKQQGKLTVTNEHIQNQGQPITFVRWQDLLTVRKRIRHL